jgi:hypothetical protein
MKWGILAIARTLDDADADRMTETHHQPEDERDIERRQERQGWLLLIGGFALAGILVIAASFL